MMLDTDQPPKQEVIKEELSLIMSSLPEEIIVDILSFLPVKSIFRFRCVCKNWCNNLFRDSKFIRLHLNHSNANNKFRSLLTTRSMVPMYSVNWCHSLPVSSAHNNNKQSVVEIIDSPFYLEDFYSTYASCDGLILMYNPYEYQGVILWNPSTKEIMEIPEPPMYSAIPTSSGSIDHFEEPYDEPTIITVSTQYGLGYSPILDDYKIVITETTFKIDEWVCDGCYVEVYSLGSNSWKTIPGIIPYDLLLGGKAIKPVMFNGALHWIGSSCISLKKGRELSVAISIVIISFDIENDTFKEVPLTPELQESLCYDHTTILDNDHRWVQFQESTDIFMGTFHGYLSIVQGGDLDLTRNNNGDVSIWVMKEYGVKESWIKMFSVSVQSMERSVKCSTAMTAMDFRNGFLFLKDKTSLVAYDAENKTGRAVFSGDLSIEGLSYVDTYVESLVPLNSGMYLGQGVLASRLNYLARRMRELGATWGGFDNI